MLHPQSPLPSYTSFTADMGINDHLYNLPLIKPLPSKIFTGIVWGNICCQGIIVNSEFTTNCAYCVKPHLISYANKMCRVMGYCSSAIDTKDGVYPKVRMLSQDSGITCDTVSLTGGDVIMIKSS